MSDKDTGFIGDMVKFYKDSVNFLKNCQKPDKKGKLK